MKKPKMTLSKQLNNLIKINPQVEAKYLAEHILPQILEMEKSLNLLQNMPYGSQIRRDCGGAWEADLQDMRGSWETEIRYKTDPIEVLAELKRLSIQNEQQTSN